MTNPTPTWLDTRAGDVPPASGRAAVEPSPTGADAGSLGFGLGSRPWPAYTEPPSATAFIMIVIAIAVLSVVALLAGASGSPTFSFGLALGIGVGAVPYILFFAAHTGFAYATGAHHRRRRLTEEEWQRIFGNAGAAGARAGAASTNDGQDASGPEAAAPDPEQRELLACECLGVTRHASIKEIKTAYHRLAHRFHPDKAIGQGEEAMRLAEQRMKELNAAYDILRNRLPPS